MKTARILAAVTLLCTYGMVGCAVYSFAVRESLDLVFDGTLPLTGLCGLLCVVHIVLALKHLVEDVRGHEKFLVPVDPDGLHDVEVGAGQVFGDFLMRTLDQLGVGHIVELFGQLKVLTHAARALKYIVMVQRHQNGTYVELYVFSEMDHNFFLLIDNL